MTTFIQGVLNDLSNKGTVFSSISFVMPNKRSGVVLKNELAKIANEFQFAPKVYTVEEFVQEISELNPITPTRLIMESYSAYKDISQQEHVDSFDQFLNWGPRLLQDFIEIDRYLIEIDSLFEGIMQLKSIEAFGQDPKTPMVSNYLKFWKQLRPFYHKLNEVLTTQGLGHQGTLYRTAIENLENYINAHQNDRFVLLGFNALNASEERIFKELLSNNMASIYWDNDRYFLTHEMEESGLFMRSYFNSWKHYKDNHPLGIHDQFKAPKKINAIGTPKSVGQAKYVGNLIKQLWEKNKCENTAIVLADETLLIPLLSAIPIEVKVVNITMGFPLKATPIASLFASLFELHAGQNSNQFYYKHVLNVLSNPFVGYLIGSNKAHTLNTIRHYIHEQNLMFVDQDQLKQKASNGNIEWIELIFSNWDDPGQAIDYSLAIVSKIKTALNTRNHADIFAMECLYKFYTTLNTLRTELLSFNSVQSIKTLKHLFNDLINETVLDFRGEPLEGLQIMGILESRVLDFETVIVTSVNEGVLPAGKQHGSFIPFDVKRIFNLPTIKEKDAIYAYHFYHLIQRASSVHLIYDSLVDGLKGAEPSRYLLQLEVDGVHKINHINAIANTPKQKKEPISVEKTESVIELLAALAGYGYSPSALSLFIKDPLAFYYRYVLGVKDSEQVEEAMEARTFGNAIHNTLEELYQQHINEYLSEQSLTKMIERAPDCAYKHFKEQLKGADIRSGKNLLTFEIGKHYIMQLLQHDLSTIKDGNTIKIISIEEKLEAVIDIPELDFPVKLRGKIDRVDQLNGKTRIIDYKTGQNISATHLQIKDWSLLGIDYDRYHKCFQILCYAFLWRANFPETKEMEGGIFALKKLSLGLLKLGIPNDNGKGFHYDITPSVIDDFKMVMTNLISLIHNPKQNFDEIVISKFEEN